MHGWPWVATWIGYGLATALLLALRWRGQTVRYAGPLYLLATIAILCALGEDALTRIHPAAARAAEAAAMFAGGCVAIWMADAWFLDRARARRGRPPVPRVFRGLMRGALSAVLLLAIVRTFFPSVNLNVLAVSSLVVGYIFGNATQDTLGNLVAGLAMNTERGFGIGDWILVAGHEGEIVEMNWRATRLLTKSADTITIPNSMLAREAVVNLSRPTRVHAIKVPVGASYDDPPNRVRAAVLDALRDCPGVLTDPAPRVWLTGYNDSSIGYEVKFFINDYSRSDAITTEAMGRVWYVFRRAGITIPFPIRDVRLWERNEERDRSRAGADADDRARALGEAALFGPLTDDERRVLAADSREVLYAAGETLVRQGEEGDALYLVRAGRLRVRVEADGRRLDIGELAAGEVFGEMSVLTGEPRSATVCAAADARVLRVPRDTLGRVLRANTALASALADVMESRRDRLADGRRSVADTGGAPETKVRGDLARRIRRFFGLSA